MKQKLLYALDCMKKYKNETEAAICLGLHEKI